MKQKICTHENLFKNPKSLSNHKRWCEGKLQRKDSKRCPNCNVIIHPQADLCKPCSATGSKNSQWKGKEASYGALHDWVKRHLMKPQTCRDCNQPKPLDLANISQEYKRELSDWEWLCRSCHMKKDGRLERLHAIRRKDTYKKEAII